MNKLKTLLLIIASVFIATTLWSAGEQVFRYGVIDQTLTASYPVFTDANKKLTSAGTQAVNRGGTGAATLADGFVLLGSGTAAITPLDVTVKGSILVGDGATDPVALAVGADTHVLTADSGEVSGLKWAAGGGGGGVTWTVQDHTIADTLTVGEMDGFYIATNQGAGASVTLTLPVSPTEGLRAGFKRYTAEDLVIQNADGKTFHWFGSSGAVNGTLTMDSSSYIWLTYINGEWTVEIIYGVVTISE